MNNTDQTIIIEPDWNQIETYLTLIHGRLDGLINIRALPSKEQIFSNNRAEINNFIAAHIKENIYCGVASRKNRDGSKAGCFQISSLWEDIDFKDLPGGLDDAIALLKKFPLMPSMVILTGNGLHLYWLLREPISATLEIECYLKGIGKELCADPAATEIARIMRVPGTFNHKNKNAVVLAELMLVNENRYVLSDFERWKIDAQYQRSNRKVNFTESGIDVDIYKFVLSTKIINLIKGEWRKYGYNSRSEADQAVVTALIANGATYDEVKAIFQCYPVGEKYREKESAGDAYLKHCIQSAGTYIGGTDPKNSDLPEIDAKCGDLAAMASQAWNALIKANDPPEYFVYGANLIRIEKTDEKQPTIKIATENRLRHQLARVAFWFKPKDLRKDSAHPPLAVVKDMLARPDPPLPSLRRIIEAPMFGKDGELIITPGYHPAAQVYYSPQVKFAVAPIPKQPSEQKIEAARNVISDVLIDFPFVPLQERANAIAIMLLPFVRDLIDGPTPLHLIEKPSPGTGASLLAEILIYPSIGRPLPVLSEARDEDEWRKRITAKLLTGPSVILIDNIGKRLESSALATALTGLEFEDRLLGQNEVIDIPVRCVWIATGNNPVLSPEIARRSVRIRLDAKTDRPWLNRQFKYPNIREWVAIHRAELVHACLVLIQAWIAAGKPLGTVGRGNLIGSFESWAMTMGGILAVAGINGFLSNLNDFYEESDAEGASWRAFVAAWFEKFGDSPVGVSTLYEQIVLSDEAIDIALGDGSDQSKKSRLGKRLHQKRDVVFDGFRISAVGRVSRARQWKLTKVNE